MERETDAGAERGEVIVARKIPWSWDPTPETGFRYSAVLPIRDLPSHPAPLWVIDYLIAIPRPGSQGDIDSIMEKVYALGDMAEVRAYLDGFKDRLIYFLPPPSWNVKGVRR